MRSTKLCTCLCCVSGCREAWSQRLAQLKQEEEQEAADARERALQVRQAAQPLSCTGGRVGAAGWLAVACIMHL